MAARAKVLMLFGYRSARRIGIPIIENSRRHTDSPRRRHAVQNPAAEWPWSSTSQADGDYLFKIGYYYAANGARRLALPGKRQEKESPKVR